MLSSTKRVHANPFIKSSDCSQTTSPIKFPSPILKDSTENYSKTPTAKRVTFSQDVIFNRPKQSTVIRENRNNVPFQFYCALIFFIGLMLLLLIVFND